MVRWQAGRSSVRDQTGEDLLNILYGSSTQETGEESGSARSTSVRGCRALEAAEVVKLSWPNRQ